MENPPRDQEKEMESICFPEKKQAETKILVKGNEFKERCRFRPICGGGLLADIRRCDGYWPLVHMWAHDESCWAYFVLNHVGDRAVHMPAQRDEDHPQGPGRDVPGSQVACVRDHRTPSMAWTARLRRPLPRPNFLSPRIHPINIADSEGDSEEGDGDDDLDNTKNGSLGSTATTSKWFKSDLGFCILFPLLGISKQQRSHVPKFGSWDSDNIPYTAYFENARKEKGSSVMMNPNDPEENPEAFMFGRVGTGSEGHRRNTSDHQKSGSHKSTNSESGSDKSNSEYALQQQNHRRTRKNSITEANNFVRPSRAHDRLRSANNPSEDKSYSSASVPKFGVWDEKDPKSGEGFTVIFNKVKEEKQIAATKLPTVPPQPRSFEKSQKKHTGSKICCCLVGGGSD
ncbi:uncharacterized protein LOC130782257 [Actinidia eriantha]|uniref:uncharacterized protein LOC130782257 n=1 Tax=Actinidia eriantha TaxID=165200 RepID=UPI00258B5939|nr:uncharacterized protein LOC130782257 [Actinidia eriantha]